MRRGSKRTALWSSRPCLGAAAHFHGLIRAWVGPGHTGRQAGKRSRECSNGSRWQQDAMHEASRSFSLMAQTGSLYFLLVFSRFATRERFSGTGCLCPAKQLDESLSFSVIVLFNAAPPPPPAGTVPRHYSCLRWRDWRRFTFDSLSLTFYCSKRNSQYKTS